MCANVFLGMVKRFKIYFTNLSRKRFFANARNVLDFPYFWACSPTIFVRRGFLIDCEDLAKLGLVEKSERSEFTIK